MRAIGVIVKDFISKVVGVMTVKDEGMLYGMHGVLRNKGKAVY